METEYNAGYAYTGAAPFNDRGAAANAALLANAVSIPMFPYKGVRLLRLVFMGRRKYRGDAGPTLARTTGTPRDCQGWFIDVRVKGDTIA